MKKECEVCGNTIKLGDKIRVNTSVGLMDPDGTPKIGKLTKKELLYTCRICDVKGKTSEVIVDKTVEILKPTEKDKSLDVKYEEEIDKLNIIERLTTIELSLKKRTKLFSDYFIVRWMTFTLYYVSVTVILFYVLVMSTPLMNWLASVIG